MPAVPVAATSVLRMPPGSLAPALLMRRMLSAGTLRRQQLHLMSTCSWCSGEYLSLQTQVMQLKTAPLACQLALTTASLCWLLLLLPTPAGTHPG